MAIMYTRAETVPDWLHMPREQVQIWNILSQGPLNAWTIHTRLHGSDYDDVIRALGDMERAGIIRASYSH